ncbi:MAG: Omp28-related outer membrane protein [Bacteroidales bacterium]
MKKFILTSIFYLLLVVILQGQQVPRDQVVIEVGTGTWCQYCPGAAMAIEDLLNNGYNVAAIKYHSGDSYQTPASIARINYYNITGFPTAWFDGTYNVVGGSNNQSMYPYYLPYVNQRNSVLSSFTLSISGNCTGLQYNVTIQANKVASYNQNNLRLHLALTESHIPEFWQGQSEVNHAMRIMVPDYNGTLLDFSSQNQQTVNLTFNADPSWEIQNCELIAFLQNPTTKEIVQGTKIPLMNVLPTLDHDLGLRSLTNIPADACQEWLKPVLVMANYGSQNVQNATLQVKINEVPFIVNWSGNLPYLGRDTFELDTLHFSLAGTNQVIARVLTVNGQPDQNAVNDSLIIQFTEATQYYKSPVTLVLKTDNNPQETTWELVNSHGEVLYTGGPYQEPNKLFFVNMNLSPNDCYRFVIHDAGKNGICCSHGSGLYKLVDVNNQTIISGKDFLMSESTDFKTGTATVLLEQDLKQELFYTLEQRTLRVYSNNNIPVEVVLFDLSGKSILSGLLTAGIAEINLQNQPRGIYILQLVQGTKIKHYKIVLE